MVTVLVKIVPFLAVSSIAYPYVFSNRSLTQAKVSPRRQNSSRGLLIYIVSDKFSVSVYDNKESQFICFRTRRNRN
jgi:hypothetical protein